MPSKKQRAKAKKKKKEQQGLAIDTFGDKCHDMIHTEGLLLDSMIETTSQGYLAYLFPSFQELVQVQPSPLHGKGLFATRDIPAGTIVTLYPMDYLVHCPTKQGRVAHRVQQINKDAKTPTNLDHLSAYKQNIEKVTRFDLAVNFPGFDTSISADPSVQKRGLLGHLANDAVVGTVEDPLSYLKSYEQCNVLSAHLGFYHVALISSTVISKGDEILYHYGLPYWCEGGRGVKYALKRHPRAKILLTQTIRQQLKWRHNICTQYQALGTKLNNMHVGMRSVLRHLRE